MDNSEQWQNLGQELELLLCLRTFPVAVKMLSRASDIPAKAFRPLRDSGRRLDACQALALSRREGRTVSMLKEDNWCPAPVAGYGLADPTDFYLDGFQQVGHFSSLEASRKWCQTLPRFELNRYVGLVSAPLTSASFAPDVVLLWVDSAQLCILTLAHNWTYGRDVISRLSARAACIFEIVPAMQTKEFQVAVPCLGERRRAGTTDHEMVFCLPGDRGEEFVASLKLMREKGYRFPIPVKTAVEWERRPEYEEWSRLLGLD
ncbi:MAG: DUF169 domain-containing protein [Thermodesulfobacteriota bacterium]